MASSTFGIMKGGKMPALAIITSIICAIAFVILLYNETFTSLSPKSILKLRTCPEKNSSSKFTTRSKPDERSMEEHVDDLEGEERKLEFDPDICDVYDGKWVFNTSAKPLYSDRTCPYVDLQFSCTKNGRPDSGYLEWEWHPDECRLPRFNPEVVLKRLKGKRLMFVGDSLIRGQWESFVCMVEWIIPEDQKSMKSGRFQSVFRAKEYNATMEFYWAPFLVESNSDRRIIGDPKKRILRVDSIRKHAKHWEDVDILVFGTYVWWMSGLKIKSLWGSFANGEEGYEELETPVAYKIGLKTWANWVDSTIDTNKTRVFFTTMSPTHSRSLDWGGKDGMKCYNETRPIMKKGFWGTGSNKQLMKAAVEVVDKMKVPVTFINVTQISEYRVDGHASVYSETGGKLLTDEQREDPGNADCIHWCLPGVPDTWNQIFYAYLLQI